VPFLGALSRLPSFYSAEGPVVVSEIVKILGPLLEHWKGDYNAVGTSDDSSYRKSAKLIEAMIKHVRPNVSQTEREHIVPSMMSKGFCYLPECRISATQLQQDASFKAVMEICSRGGSIL
jgi:hypothetical protein